MTTRYVGPGGNDANSGLSWALRKLTLNGVEDTPVVAGDTIYVGPGVYRELLTADIDGSAGNPITYIGDITGEHTDGVGGIARITGSDNDQTATRAQGILSYGRNFRTFRGFLVDLTTNCGIHLGSSSNQIAEDCAVINTVHGIGLDSDWGGSGNTIRRCLILGVSYHGINHYNAALSAADPGHLVQNCMIIGGGNWCSAVNNVNMGGVDVNNSLLMGHYRGVYCAQTGIAASNINNCIIINCGEALASQAAGDIVEDYNALWGNTTNRVNTGTGGNSNTYPPLFNPSLLLDGFRFPWQFGELSKWSQVARIAGTGEASDDLFGLTRPATSAKKSWGAVQYVSSEVEATTVQAGSYSRKMDDAGQVMVRRVPCTAVSTAVTIYVRRETDYAGSVPRMIIRQPGQSDRTKDMTAAVDTWEQLSDSFTPAVAPGYFEIWVESRNTAAAGDYAVFYDTLAVT